MATIATHSQPSYYYLLIACACVARSRRAPPARALALRQAANQYFEKSLSGGPSADPPPQCGR
jgi:hypothetical protein